MYKKILSILLCFLLLFTVALPVSATNGDTAEEEVRLPDLTITDKKAFLAFAENCRLDSYSQDLYVVLDADLDLTDTDFAGVPIFCGIFDGQGHTIKGIKLTADGSAQGLFRYLTDTALVQNLTVFTQINPGGSRSRLGAIAGQNAGSILDCRVHCKISGANYVGGIVGTNTVTGIVDGCLVVGEVCGEHFVGGIAGENMGVIRNCENNAPVNITAQQNSVKITDISIETVTNSEALNTVTDIGGIAGNSTGVIRSCINHADVGYQHMGYNIGGLAGTQVGYITECENYGFIQGRKEVGGLVGQMEPVSVIEYTEDTLQILKGQLATMTGLVNRTSSNAQKNAGSINTYIGALESQTQNARDAIEALIPEGDDFILPDADSLLAAQSTLSNSLTSMTGSVRGIANATRNTVNSLSRDLQAVSSQISAMSQTIGEADENIGGTITDVSDLDTPEDLTGKVERSVNYGGILGDMNIGGIAGALAVENDLDLLEDWEEYGEESMNFNSELRAVVLDCSNHGAVTGLKENVGGIAGWQSMGLVKASTNTGNLDGENASHVGGISGISTGFIRGCNAKCEIHGSTYAGGIAGSASIVTDSLSLVKLVGVSEKVGAILGDREEPTAEEENPIADNYYLCVDGDIGAIDSISYEGLAKSLNQNDFLVQQNLSSIFKTVQIRFLFEDGNRQVISLALGGQLNPIRIPEVPQKDGYTGTWEGLAEAELTNILFDMTFEANYAPYRTTLKSLETTENGRPMFLLEGSFTDEAVISLTDSTAVPTLLEGETLTVTWTLNASEAGEIAHVWLPETENSDQWKLMVRDASGNWQETSFHRNGSYLVFPMTQTCADIALVQQRSQIPMEYIIGTAGLAVLLIVLITTLSLRKKRKRKAQSV